MERMNVTMPISKIDNEERIVYGVVYKASKEFDENGKPTDFVDTDHNWATEAEVKKACHNFNRKLQKPKKVQKSAGVSASDQLQLSSTGKDYQTAKAAVKTAPDIREDLVASIKASMEAGTYQVSGESFADKLFAKYEEMR